MGRCQRCRWGTKGHQRPGQGGSTSHMHHLQENARRMEGLVSELRSISHTIAQGMWAVRCAPSLVRGANTGMPFMLRPTQSVLLGMPPPHPDPGELFSGVPTAWQSPPAYPGFRLG